MLLPTAALSHACRLFDGAFASIDGDELSAAYTRSKPPPPTWSSSSAPGGKVVDSYYASLTYGEPSHLALSLYAPAASRAALLNRHPPHAPLCSTATHLTRRSAYPPPTSRAALLNAHSALNPCAPTSPPRSQARPSSCHSIICSRRLEWQRDQPWWTSAQARDEWSSALRSPSRPFV